MSNTTSSGGFPALSGGVPIKNQDFVASIVFAFAFAILLLPAAYRIIRSESRSTILIRPTIFALAQTVAYALRAIIANGQGSTKLFEASEILLLAGLTLVCEPVPALLSRRLGGWKKGRAISNEVPVLVQRALGLLRIAVTIALILGIVAATDISDNETASEKASIKTYRTANAAIILSAMALSALLAISQIKTGLLTTRSVFWTCAQCLLLVITAAYKLVNITRPSQPFDLSSKIVFYVLNSALDWVVAAMFFAFNLNSLFPFPDKSTLNDVPLGNRNPQIAQQQVNMVNNKPMPMDAPYQRYQQYPQHQQAYGAQPNYPQQGYPQNQNQRLQV